MDTNNEYLTPLELWQKCLDDCNEKQSILMQIMQKEATQLSTQLNLYVWSDVKKLTKNISKLFAQYEDIAKTKNTLLRFREDNSDFFRN